MEESRCTSGREDFASRQYSVHLHVLIYASHDNRTELERGSGERHAECTSLVSRNKKASQLVQRRLERSLRSTEKVTQFDEEDILFIISSASTRNLTITIIIKTTN